ncbi:MULTISPECIES: hypothetical protein [Pseudomonas]|jgi:hypothetical protein|uniref:Uncharacterized protein n=1 Tax=Serpens gallinarum TaxID=2763075 RepID=A0ABR8TPG2_9PSED|nr:hypothetical protein [Serpens gallinarum]MBD7977656.1 hypothetical protein [Serpens gallinarum]
MGVQQDNALINAVMEQVVYLVSHPSLNAEEIEQTAVDQVFTEVRQSIWHDLSDKLELAGRELDEHTSKAIDAIIYLVSGLGQDMQGAADEEARLTVLNDMRSKIWYVVENEILKA